jgi:hypothetical protein
MAETLHKEPVYSGEPLETAKVQSPAETPKTIEPSEAEKAPQPSKPTLKSQVAGLLENTRTHGQPSLVEFAKFLNRTRRVWLLGAAGILGLIVAVTLLGRLSEWARNARERRHEQAVATVTPDRLIARCGPPAEDATKEVYPILMRTITYQSDGGEKRVLAFSRTAEEKSDWVFLTMKNESGATSYDTPEAKIAALPCLDSKK